MQTKVSMVIPCYNKEKYMARTLECVYNQEWNNIEVIIVNDGSTDNTLEIITQWEPKLILRGYEVVIIDQVNSGVAVAVKNGIIRSTGEYVCIPDADDEFSPYYVSYMARVLDDRSDVDWVWCNISDKNPLLEIKRKDRLLLLQLLHQYIFWSVWTKLYRKSYIEKCGVIEKYVDSRLTQEPQFFIPLAAGGSFPYLLCEKLYFYNATDSSIMSNVRKDFNSMVAFWERYRDLEIEVLRLHHLSSKANEYAIDIAFLANIQRDCLSLQNKKWRDLVYDVGCLSTKKVDDSLQEYIGSFGFEFLFGLEPKISNDLINALETSQRIICCCCLGSCGRRLLPQLATIGITPDLYWDKNAHKVKDTSYKVHVPDYASLTANDLLLILSDIDKNIAEIQEAVGDNVPVFSARAISPYINWRSYEMLQKINGKPS